jgi:hypothetical protein
VRRVVALVCEPFALLRAAWGSSPPPESGWGWTKFVLLLVLSLVAWLCVVAGFLLCVGFFLMIYVPLNFLDSTFGKSRY